MDEKNIERITNRTRDERETIMCPPIPSTCDSISAHTLRIL